MKPLEIGMANCPVCKKDFMKHRVNQTCCSKICVTKQSNKKNKLCSQFQGFNGSTGTKGAIQELKVSADLLRKGYQVFRSVSPSCHCDLVIISKDGSVKRVEVRSATKSRLTGKLFFNRNGQYDIIASVFRDKIQYESFTP